MITSYDNEQIKPDFNDLYQQMSGMPLREMKSFTLFVSFAVTMRWLVLWRESRLVPCWLWNCGENSDQHYPDRDGAVLVRMTNLKFLFVADRKHFSDANPV